MEKASELQTATTFGSVAVVAELCGAAQASMYIDQGVGAMQTTALACAAQAGRLDMANVLLEAGADVDASDALGRSPLMFAVANGETALIAPLLARGANTSLRAENGWTPLMFACALGHYEAAAALLEASLGDKDQSLFTTQQAMLSMQSAHGLAREHEQPGVTALLSHLLEQEGTPDVSAALLHAREAAQEAEREAGRRMRRVMDTCAPLPTKSAKEQGGV